MQVTALRQPVGVDAVIVQDLGLARLIHAIAPSLPIHGSTQMTLTEPRGIEFVRELGVERVGRSAWVAHRHILELDVALSKRLPVCPAGL